jgi:phenylalanyl-tRNA synthetase alpha chain
LVRIKNVLSLYPNQLSLLKLTIMSKNVLIYLEDSYLNSITAKIAKLETDGKSIKLWLSKTIFYPQGGGQPSDRGTITGKSGSVQVSRVVLSDTGQVIHQGTLTGSLKKGDVVELRLDWDHRYHNMQAHTAGHLLDEAVKEALPEYHGISGMHGINGQNYIEFSGFIDAAHQEAIQKAVDTLILNDESITIRFVTLEEIAKENIPLPFKLPKNKPLRLITVGERTPVPDGGTQLKSSGESWPIKVSEFEYHEGNTRIHYTVTKPSMPDTKQPEKDKGLTIQEFKQAIAAVNQTFNTKPVGKNIHAQYLGKKGQINKVSRIIPKLPEIDRPQAGRLVNQLKQHIESKLAEGQNINSSNHRLDVTAPGDKPPIGHLHPISHAIEEISRIFQSIGFTRVRYPEVDYDHYVFESLNMPDGHPARDEWETFFIETPKNKVMGEMVLTTHTSNGQVREMERVGTPPIRMLNLGKCYRRQQDITHTAMFHQFEGLVIDKGINISHLKGTLDYFAKRYYGKSAKSRIRPFMFKFTEPSFEVDFSCTHCVGKGCRFCKSGWHEVGGAGMVHPNVLKAGGIDPEIYTGFAFGWGVERVYTLKPGLNLDDIRPLYSTNLEFLANF